MRKVFQQMDFEIIKQSIDLSCTVSEGLEHIKNKYEEGYYEDALVLLQDVVQAFFSIQQAIGPILMQLPQNELEFRADMVTHSLDHIVKNYEQRNWALVRETMQYQLIPSYFEWKEELQHCLTGYIAS